MNVVMLTCAYAIDWIAGDPEWFPHPVRLMGALISRGQTMATPGRRSPAHDLWIGALVVVIVVGAATAGAALVLDAARRVDMRVAWLVEVLLAWTVLSTGSLLTEATRVIVALEEGDLPTARTRLSRIVGRDTANLDASEIARGVIETLAESTCDGIVAPLCFLVVGGVPAAFAYKAVNTIDSMVGHREAPYTYFGRVGARLDDVANFVPARIAAAVIVIAAACTRGHPANACRIWWRDGARHDSPNAGRPEAAMAGALAVRLGGTNWYEGVPVAKPVIGAEGGAPSVSSARAACRVVAVASVTSFLLAVLAVWLWAR